jgi:hypothetical protein
MKVVRGAAIAALIVGLPLVAQASAPPAPGAHAPLVSAGSSAIRLSQGIPSDVEQKLGIPPNASRRHDVERRYRGRGLPSDVEQKLGIRRNVPSDHEQRRRHYGRSDRGWAGPPVYFDDRRAQCERRAHRRGLYGYEFARYVRWCVQN